MEYERVINTEVRRRLGGSSSGDLIIRSFNFADIERLQAAGQWGAAAELLCGAARDLEYAGADVLVLCTNTMHRVADEIATAVSIPMIHIADATADAVVAAGVRTVGLLGTRYTMEEEFYAGRLRRHGLDVRVPRAEGRELVHRVIYDELVRGVVSPEAKDGYLAVIEGLRGQGCGGIVAGCTEIELLIHPDDIEVPLFPTARLHALAAVEFALRP